MANEGIGYSVTNTVRSLLIAALPPSYPPTVLHGRYTLVSPDGSPLPVAPEAGHVDIKSAKPAGLALGQGGYGVVVRAEDSLRIPRALKFFQPRELGFTTETTTYEREIQLTNQQPFKSVIRIMDYGIANDLRGEDYGVYVMDFVPGISLGTFMAQEVFPNRDNLLASAAPRKLLYSLAFRLLDQLVSAARELHAAGVVHMDIKPQNVLVMTGSVVPRTESLELSAEYKLFLTDLGAGKKISPNRKGPTKLIRTELYFPEHLLGNLEHNRDENTVSYEKLLIHGEAIDLYCLGKTIEELFFDRGRRSQEKKEPLSTMIKPAQESEKEEFWKIILGHEFKVLELIVDDLLSRSSRRIKSAEALFAVLTKISRRSAADVHSSDILTDRYPGEQIRVAKTLVSIAQPLNEVVAHPLFQRLKLQGQLALIHQIFPGATHTRFAHSLLTFDLAKRYLLSLSKNSLFRYLFQRPDIDTILCAALLHDLGQYPFAHSFEDLRKAGDLFQIDYLKQVQYDQELLEVFANKSCKGVRTIASFLADIDVSLEDVKKLILKKKDTGLNAQMRIGQDIVNGTIDVDRLSYLNFDSYMTGVPYGQGVDLDGLTENLTIRYDPSIPVASSLAIREAGISAAEMVLAAVYWMYRNVYWHESNRGMMAVLKHIFSRLLESEEITFAQYIDDTIWKSDRDAMHYLHDLYSKFGDDSEGSPIYRLIAGHRLGYRCILEIGHSGPEETATFESIVFKYTDDKVEDLKAAVAGVYGDVYRKGSSSILLDIPLKPRLHKQSLGRQLEGGQTEAEAATGIKLWVEMNVSRAGRQASWSSIQDCSGLAHQVSEEEHRHGRKVRLFVRESLLEKCDKLKLKQLEDQVLQEITALVEKW